MDTTTNTIRSDTVSTTKKTSRDRPSAHGGSRSLLLVATVLAIGLALVDGCSAERRVEKRVRKGEIYLHERQLTRAAAEFETVLEIDPDNIGALYQLGAVRAAQNAPDRAAKCFQRVIELDPHHREAYRALGRAYIAQQDYDGLLGIADKLDEAGLFSSVAENFRGLAANATGDIPAAVEAFTRATAEDPQFTEAWTNLAAAYHQLRDYAAAEAACRAAIDAVGPQEHSLQMLLAEALRRQGKADEAIPVLLTDIEYNPDQVENRVRLGDIYLHTNRVDKLRELGTAILERNPRSAFGQYFVAVADLSEGKYERSADRLAAVVSAAPQIPEARLYLALAQEQLGAIQQAITHAREYLRAAPDSVQARVLLARLYSREGWTEEAVEMINEAGALDPGNVDVLAMRGMLALGQQDYDTATREFESMLEQAPDDIRAPLSLALVALSKKNPDGAITHARGVVDVAPNDPRAYNVLGLAYLQKGDIRSALLELVQARALRPDFVPVRRNLARVYESLGQFEAAEAEYRAIVEARPNDVSAHAALGYLMLARGDYDRAAKEFRRVLALRPDDVRTRIALATTLSHSGAADEAVEMLSERLTDSAAAPRLYYAIARIEFRRRAYKEAVESYSRAIELDPNLTDAYVDQGLALMMDGKAAEGAERIAAGRKTVPSAWYTLRYEAAARILAGQTDAALKLLEAAQASGAALRGLEAVVPIAHLAAGDPATARTVAAAISAASPRDDVMELVDYCDARSECPVTWIPASMVLLERGWLASALDAADRAVEELPDICMPYLVRAGIRLRLRDTRRALEDFRTVLSLRPGYPAAVREAATAHVRLGEYDAAVSLLERAVETEPDNLLWVRMLGELEMRRGNDEQARLLFERVLNAEPGDPEAANNLAYLYLADGQRVADALRLAEQAARVLPVDGDLLDTLGWAYLKNGRIDEALETLSLAAALRPTNPTVLYHYGEALNRTGRPEQAEQTWQAALDLGTEFPEADTVRAALAVYHSDAAASPDQG